MARTPAKPATAAMPTTTPPGYDLPEKLETHATSITGSQASSDCLSAADFIRELISANTSLKTRLIKAERLMRAIRMTAESL